jgi:hypothetical protein
VEFARPLQMLVVTVDDGEQLSGSPCDAAMTPKTKEASASV